MSDNCRDLFFTETTATALGTYSAYIGDGVNTTYNITHNLNSEEVTYSLRDVQTDVLGYAQVNITGPNTVTISFDDPPALTAFYLTIFASITAKQVTGFEDRITVNVAQPVQDISVNVADTSDVILVSPEQDVITISTSVQSAPGVTIDVGVVDTQEQVNVVVDESAGLWGTITGILSAQTDLWKYLSAETFSPSQLTAFLNSNAISLCSINVNGTILSAGTDLFDIFLTSETDSQTLSYIPSSYLLSISNGNTVNLSSINSVFAASSGKYESVYSNVVSNSANWNTSYNVGTAYQNASGSFAPYSYINNNFLPLSGGIVSGSVRINNSLTVFGNLTASGTTTFANTIFSVTSALSVVHVGSGPAVWVGNNGDGDIASFYDIDQGIEILHVGGNNGIFPNVGVKTSRPNKDFTVRGELSASNTIYDNIGNSSLWNQAYNTATVYQTNSATYAPKVELRGHSMFSSGDYAVQQGRNVELIFSASAAGTNITITLPRQDSNDNAQAGDELLIRLNGVSNNSTVTIRQYTYIGSLPYLGTFTNLITFPANTPGQTIRLRLGGSGGTLGFVWTLLPTPNLFSPTQIGLIAPNTGTFTTLSATGVVHASGGNSNLWNTTYSLVQSNSASWEESADILPTVTNYLSTSNVLISALTVTNNLSVSRTTNLSNVNVTGVFNFGQGTPALNVRNDGIVVVNTLSAATISATQIVGFETYDQSLNTTDTVLFQQVNIGSTEYTDGTINATGYGRAIGLDDGSIGGDFSFDTAIGFQGAAAAGTRDNLGLGPNNNVQFAFVGINTTTPNERLTVVGNISSTGVVYSSGGNSNQWNQAAPIDRSGLSISLVGAWQTPPLYLIEPEGYPVVQGEAPNTTSGKWISRFWYTESNATIGPRVSGSLVFNDLYGVKGAFNLRSLASITSLESPTLVYVGQENDSSTTISFNPNAMAALTAMSFPALQNVAGNFTPTTMAALTAMSFPALQNVAGNFSPAAMAAHRSLDFPALQNVGINFNVTTMTGLTALNFPALRNIGNILNVNSLNSTPNIAIINFSALQNVGTVSIGVGGFMNSIRDISFPALQNAGIGGIAIGGTMTSLTAINLSAIQVIGGNFAGGTLAALSSITFPPLGTWKALIGNVTFTSPLNTTTVNNLMSALAYMDGNNGTTLYGSGRTVTVTGGSAPTHISTVTTPGSQFVCSGTTCTVSWISHGYNNGDVLRVSGITTATNANRYAVITVVNADQFTYTITSQNATGGGTATVSLANNDVKAIVTRGVTLTTA